MAELNLDPQFKSILDEIVRRIVEVAHPDRVILFGSAVRGAMGPDSDFDILVVKSGPIHRRHTAQKIHGAMFGVGAPVDIIVVTPEDVEESMKGVGSIIPVAVSEGVQLYAA
ncbi:MAG: nucleotidyltransferase domain-containing protein [Deltaproteobacteria bacterium]|nr:nucleotidyltransferase domain-containing protein [Deltaproteobacteria bacterium]